MCVDYNYRHNHVCVNTFLGNISWVVVELSITADRMGCDMELKIREMRQKVGMSQEELADKVGKSCRGAQQ